MQFWSRNKNFDSKEITLDYDAEKDLISYNRIPKSNIYPAQKIEFPASVLDRVVEQFKKPEENISSFKKYQEGKETWYEAKIDNHFTQVVQEVVGDNNWWNVKVDGKFLLNSDNEPLHFNNVEEAKNEILSEINKK